MRIPPNAYSSLTRHLSDWALAQPAIAAVIVVGSRARLDHPADEWSDLDLVVFANEATSFLQDSTWLSAFGTVVAAISNSFGEHDREWIALYDDASKLDVAFLSIDPAVTPTLQAMLDAFPYPVVLQRGVRVLVDKTSSSTEVRLPAINLPSLPTQAEFTALINRIALDAIKSAKFIRRHDLWRAKQLCDGEMKQHLLTVLEWQAAVQQDKRDIWYDGRFLAEWADREAWIELPQTFALFDAADLSRALRSTLDLFRRLAHQVAERLHFAYPNETDRFIDYHIRALI